MATLKLPIVLIIILLFLNAIRHKHQPQNIKQGHLTFLKMNTDSTQGFQILIHDTLPPNTSINFTDSKWNGNHFNIKESNIVWLSGSEPLLPDEKIEFKNLNQNPMVSKGTLKGKMKLSARNEAIFAYLGHNKMPRLFLAVISTDSTAYGTLLNTQLTRNELAILHKP